MPNLTSTTTTMDLLEPDAKPPRSKSAPYYSIHPYWQDVSPIPQADQTGALAAIAYSPRYSEAMSYLRALMAENEVSDRALALTEDLIGMNPAHYTVWIYRMRILQGLWASSKGEIGTSRTAETIDDVPIDPSIADSHTINEKLWNDISTELIWLDEVSARNLKNYQIWHHRHALADLLPADPQKLHPPQSGVSPPPKPLSEDTRSTLALFIASEQRFLSHILSLDTKNYHVWSYRQWLCSRFPSFLLPSCTTLGSASVASSYRVHPEIAAIDLMIEDDVRNNSAWSHRYFLLFGYHELAYARVQIPPAILKQVNEKKLLHKAGLVDHKLVQAEIQYTKAEIQRAPQNGSPWNFIRGVLRHGDIDVSVLRDFCEAFMGPDGDLWMDQWVEVEIEDSETGNSNTEKQQLGVRSSHAMEMLSEIYGKDGSEEGRLRAIECLKALSEKWDVIRKGYWDHRRAQLDVT